MGRDLGRTWDSGWELGKGVGTGTGVGWGWDWDSGWVWN